MSEQSSEDYEAGLRWRLEVLKAKLEAGEIVIAEHLADDFEKSLKAVRYQADGQIDLSTVDGRVRSMALGAAVAHNRQAEKDAISLTDISNIYFEFIEKNFGTFRDEAKRKGLDAHQFAILVSRNSPSVAEISPVIPKFLELLEQFWKDASDASHYHIQDLTASKAVYGGDLFPAYTQNLASTVGLYIETIVLSDPFWNSRHILRSASDEQCTYYVVKHSINVLNYRDLATADLKNPIVVVSPFKSSVDENEFEFLRGITQTDALKHAEALFGRPFGTVEELWEFGGTLTTPEAVVSAVVDKERLLFDTEWNGTKEEQIARALKAEWATMTGDANPGHLIVGQCFGRMGQATDLLLKSRYLMGTPLIDAPTSWQYFNWKLEYNSALAEDNLTHLHMVKGLQHVGQTDAQWLGNIPPAALIEMRKEGAFEEIRSVLSQGVAEIAAEKPAGYFRSSDRIVENIRDAFDQHKAEIRDLTKKKIKFAGFDLGSLLAVGTVEIAAAITGTPLFGVGAYAASQLIDAPTLKQLPERYRTLKNAHVELKKSPMGLLFKHKPRG
ncbi:hypothetical protein [Agrobacterium tumefaciens]|uniref:hypothetical protein n=1 Tax=Agrobacterium tumefaciens TaxID=358 RepID=UPI001FAAB4D7|nr:hypothetical protein [Agrobacterium tumefaciens]UNZ52845.1 hypothetical protein MLE07_18895 [Agrobacterium tumefaciens]